MADTAALIAVLELIPGALARMVGPLSPAMLHASAGGDEDWQIIEVLGHMADAAEEYADNRIQRVAHEDNPTLLAFDQDDYVRERGYRALTDVGPLLERFSAASARTVAILKDVSQDDWQRQGVHSTDGPMTLRTLVVRISGHAQVHYNQIARVLAPQMIATIAALPDRISATVAGVDESKLAARAAGEDQWTAKEVLGHLRDMPEVYTRRAEQILAEANPLMFGIDQEEYVRARHYAERPTAEILAEYRAGNAGFVTALQALPDDVWARPAIHPSRGPATFYDISVIYHLNHADIHSRQIAELLA